MRDLAEITINTKGAVRPSPTPIQVAAFQRHFGVSLPDDYLCLLRHSNGGHPEPNAFKLADSEPGTFWGVNRFYYLGDDSIDLEGLWAATRAWRSALGIVVVPIASDGGGNQIMLDYRKRVASVVLCVHDDDMSIVHVASAFGDFIDMLECDPDMI